MEEVEELQRRVAAYSYFAGKQTGSFMALLHGIEFGLMTIDDVRSRLSELLEEFTKEADKIFYKNPNQA